MHNVKHTEDAKRKISEGMKRHHAQMSDTAKQQRADKIRKSRMDKETMYRNVMANVNTIAAAMIAANNQSNNEQQQP